MGRSKAPFYTVLLSDGTNISSYCTGMTYEDCTEEDDIIRLVFRNAPIGLIEHKNVQIGKKVKVRFGYITGITSKIIALDITVIKPRYGLTNELEIIATSGGYILKQENYDTDWSGNTVAQIVSKIAKRNGLKVSINGGSGISEVTEKKQGNKTDWDFLQELAADTQGNYRVLVKADTLYWQPKAGQKRPNRVLVIGNNGVLESFVPQINDNLKTAKNAKVTASTIDPASGEVITKEANNATDKTERHGKGLVSSVRNADGVIVGNKTISVEDAVRVKSDSTGQRMQVSSDGDIQAQLDNRKANETDNEIRADGLMAQGDPTLEPDNVYSIKGAGSQYSGNWECIKVIHTLGWNSAYSTNLVFRRNALTKATGIESPNTKNTKTANVADNNKKELSRYDANGNRLGRNGNF
jgi:phage protein D